MSEYFWLIPFFPAISSLILVIFGRWLPKKYVSIQAPLAVFLSFLFGLKAFLALSQSPVETEGAALAKTLFSWIQSGQFQIDFTFWFDPLTAVMVLVVSGVGFIIHVYSIGYMAEDRSYTRYFSLLNLFTFAMLLLVMSQNVVLMFVGWEGVGLCSYLLIGFWFEKPAAASAGKKAFIVNRIGDAAFILGIFFLILNLKTASFPEINHALSSGQVSSALATLIGLLLFIGATGKSAQIPLYVWLPDAMEGPTPVSALIHAATMVTAGVYMVSRFNLLYSCSPAASEIVAIIGALTAVYAGTIALTQNDIKRVLAYSTISQIGYMFLGCGVGAYAAGMFHLYTHAFFKSLLFLAAGSVMHALSGELDMRKMGGLKKYLPLTYPTFLIGAITIAGVPFFSGFFSKDAILTQCYAQGKYLLWALGLGGAVITAFYMFRLIFLTFHGQERFSAEVRHHLHESPPVMTIPLIILAFFSVVAGYVGLPVVFGHNLNWFEQFLEPVLKGRAEAHLSLSLEWFLIIVSVAVALTGIALAYLLYQKSPLLPHQLVRRFPRFYRLLLNKYYVDEIYEAAFVQPLVRGSEAVYYGFDLPIIDGTVNGSARLMAFFGRILSLFQTGQVRDYALIFLIGVALILGLVIF